MKDAYNVTCNRLNCTVQQLFKEGFEEIIWPNESSVTLEWENLLDRINKNRDFTSNKKTSCIPDNLKVFVRGAKKSKERQNEIIDFINDFVGITPTFDPNDNQNPNKILGVTSGYVLNKNIRNYQVAHLFEERTSNPYLFCAPWMTCYVPRIIDPFTGDECPGFEDLRIEFIRHGYERNKNYITQYNNLLAKLYRNHTNIDSLFSCCRNNRGKEALIIAFSPIILDIEISPKRKELLIEKYNQKWWKID